jgi:small subunit ribosomal protein S6e
MAKFKLSVSTPDGKTQNLEIESDRALPLIGKRIGETLDGLSIGLSGKMEITGGSDKDGFPMRRDVHGGARREILISKGVGFHPQNRGERRRRRIRGNTITEDTAQVNLKVL